MLVIRFLTNKQVFKSPSWYLTLTFWWKALKNMEKCGKRGKKYFFPLFYFILLKTNTNYAHMQNFIQIPQKMKTGVQNVIKSVKDTLPFWVFWKKSFSISEKKHFRFKLLSFWQSLFNCGKNDTHIDIVEKIILFFKIWGLKIVFLNFDPLMTPNAWR